jgi:hypothetical protein
MSLVINRWPFAAYVEYRILKHKHPQADDKKLRAIAAGVATSNAVRIPRYSKLQPARPRRDRPVPGRLDDVAHETGFDLGLIRLSGGNWACYGLKGCSETSESFNRKAESRLKGLLGRKWSKFVEKVDQVVRSSDQLDDLFAWDSPYVQLRDSCSVGRRVDLEAVIRYTPGSYLRPTGTG